MKKYDLTKSVFVSLLLVSAVAVAEDKYPASDFQPKVVYQDEAAAKQADSNPVSKTSSSASSVSDSQYPAANFEPKVVFKDDNYKHNESVSNTTAAMQSTSSVVSGSASGDVITAAAPTEESSIGYLFGLIVLAAAGFVLFKKGASAGAACNKKASVQSVVRSSGGLTGVARYVLKSSGTGVSRYLEKNAKNAPSAAATGVAKYLASQVSSAKSTANQAVTGVEKYMRNKG